jgi:SAM-dependent methyltransferase
MSREWFRTFFDRAYVELLSDQKTAAATEREVDAVTRTLGLGRGERLLDVPCGFGRHAARFARRGLEVTGIDLSPAMIAEGRRRFGRRPRLTLAQGDMRRLDFRAEFAAVVNLFTGFGYFSDRSNQAVLRRFARALGPGGRLLLDHRDPDYLRAHFRPRYWWRAGRWLILEENSFSASGTLESEWTVVGRGAQRRRRLKVRFYRIAEWRTMLTAAGFRRIRAFADLDGKPHRPGRDPRLILVAERR